MRGDMELMIFQQDAFAADCQSDEHMYFDTTIAYAAVRGGKEVRVIGKSRSTVGEKDRIQ
jgi:hypothetical protein